MSVMVQLILKLDIKRIQMVNRHPMLIISILVVQLLYLTYIIIMNI